MAVFSAHQISSRGLKFALDTTASVVDEVSNEEYRKALLNVLTAQDFDSIPLVGYYEGPITSIGRRRLHDGDLQDVFILKPDEVPQLPQNSAVIECIFEVLSNEHHIVFLTHEGEIKDVVTISMLAEPIIKEYLTMLIGRLYEEGWDFNRQYLNPGPAIDYHYPSVIHEELKKLANLVEYPDKSKPPTDESVSAQIVHILHLLQPLKVWEKGTKSAALKCIEYPLEVTKQQYKEGTAGHLAQHPFGAIMEDKEHRATENLAFKLFSDANDWDRLLVMNEERKFTHFIDQYPPEKVVSKSEIEAIIPETTEFEELIHCFGPQWRPLCVQSKPYPGIISIQDLIYSEYSKFQIALTFVNLERSVRNMYLHILNTKSNRDELKYLVGKKRTFAWNCSIQRLFFKTERHLPDNMKVAGSTIQHAFDLRNSFLHNDFFIKPDDKIDHLMTYHYSRFMKKHRRELLNFIACYEEISEVPYAQFANAIEQEFKQHAKTTGSELGTEDFKSSFVHLKFGDETFHVYFDDENVVAHAKEIKTKLENRNFPWSFMVHLWEN